jgi:hypothetical protein
VANQQEAAWDLSSGAFSEGATLPAVVFHATADWKLKLSGERIGLGSLGDYWRKQGLRDWGLFWGPILLLVPAIWLAHALTRQPEADLSGRSGSAMKSPSVKTLLRVVGVSLLPLSGLFLLFSFAASMTKSHDAAIPQLFFGLFLLAVSIYFLSGAPHLVRALDRRR